MDYLKCLSKHDLISLLELAHNAILTESMVDFQSCFQKTKSLLLFDSAVSVYTHTQIFSSDKAPYLEYSLLDFNEVFFKHYTQNAYRASPIFNTLLKTWQPQHWRTLWSHQTDDQVRQNILRAYEYGYMDGWTHGSCYPANSTMTIFSFTGRKVEKDKRTKAILAFIIPYLSESLKRVKHDSFMIHRNTQMYKLTKHETEILKWLQNGKSTWQISTILNCSERVVNWHVDKIKQKLDAVNRTQAVATAMSLGYVYE